MPTLRDEKTRGTITQRLRRLTPATRAKWGKFDAPRMICHLNDALSMAVGDSSGQSENKKAFQRFPLKHLVLYVVPFPKGYPAAPEFLKTEPAAFEADRHRLVELIERLAAMPRSKGAEHPLFGPLTNDEWNALQCKHIDHHLRQFGC